MFCDDAYGIAWKGNEIVRGVVAAALQKIQVFWDVTPCHVVVTDVSKYHNTVILGSSFPRLKLWRKTCIFLEIRTIGVSRHCTPTVRTLATLLGVRDPEDEGITDNRNVCKYLPFDVAKQSKNLSLMLLGLKAQS